MKRQKASLKEIKKAASIKEIKKAFIKQSNDLCRKFSPLKKYMNGNKKFIKQITKKNVYVLFIKKERLEILVDRFFKFVIYFESSIKENSWTYCTNSIRDVFLILGIWYSNKSIIKKYHYFDYWSLLII